MYVVDRFNHRVQALNSDLTFYSTFGKYGNLGRQFNYPWGIACDSAGKVYATDTDSHLIHVFTMEGEFLRTFERCGQGRMELNRPYGVAVDTSGMVYVSEGGNHRVSVQLRGLVCDHIWKRGRIQRVCWTSSGYQWSGVCV